MRRRPVFRGEASDLNGRTWVPPSSSDGQEATGVRHPEGFNSEAEPHRRRWTRSVGAHSAEIKSGTTRNNPGQVVHAYNNAGELVGTSDPRGCGVNYHHDTAGRLIAEDYSPCLDHHAAYSAPNFASETGIEVLHRYDVADPETGTIEDAAERTLSIDTNLLWGRSVSVSDLGGKSVVSYDARGRVKGTARRAVKPGAPDTALEDRYAPRWYIKETVLDAPGRPLQTSTGASSAELMGAGGQSVVQSEYTARGLLKQATSSYGVLLASQIMDANGLLKKMTLGDAAETERVVSYDDQFRARSVQTYRGDYALWSDLGYASPSEGEPTQQLLLEDSDLEYDAVNNITKITDWRLPHEWPDSAQPVTRTFEYDDLYRLTRTTYEYSEGSDVWRSPFDAENEELETAENEPRPSPHVDFNERVKEQRYEYDHLGNMRKTTDDAQGFFDRSLGAITQGSTTAGPHRLLTASNRSTAPSSTRKGDLDVEYDDGGNVTDIIIRRDGACLPTGASCWQRFHYEWDELGQISRARRWDLSSTGSPSERDDHGEIEDALPSRTPDAELRYTYGTGGNRVLKTGIDSSENERHTVYIFGSLELRQTEWEGTGSEADYVLDANIESVLLSGGVSARLVYSEEDLPAETSGNLHVFLMLSDHLGSNTFIIDHATGELVEYATYQAYGATESNYRPERWSSFREPYKFTGKEEDVEVGLGYYGARYLSMGLGVWMSPDPVTIHEVGSDPNPYAYVHGKPLVAVDPDGKFAITAIVVGAVMGAAISATTNIAVQAITSGSIEWERVGYAALAGAAGGAATAGMAGLIGVSATAGPTFGQGLVLGIAGGAASGATNAALYKQSVGEGMMVGMAFGFVTGALSGLPPLFADNSSRMANDSVGSVGEAVAVGTGQAALAYGTARLVGGSHGAGLAAAGFGAFNGAVAGASGAYDFSSAEGWFAAVSDASWGLGGTALGDLLSVYNLASGAKINSNLTARQNRIVFKGGWTPFGPNSAVTMGPVISGYNDDYSSLTALDESRALLGHEDLHVWQNRAWGPLFGAYYVGNFVGGGVSSLLGGSDPYWGGFHEVQGYKWQGDHGGWPGRPKLPWVP